MKTAQVEQDKIVIKKTADIKLEGRKGAIVKVRGCGLCGSDIVKFREKLVPDGAVLGHEIVAEIYEIDSDTNFKKLSEINLELVIISSIVTGSDLTLSISLG